MTHRKVILQHICFTILILTLWFCIGTKVSAVAYKDIDVKEAPYEWVEDTQEGTYKTIITMHIGDTFTSLKDTSIETEEMDAPERTEDFGSVIEKQEDGSYKVVAKGLAKVTYTADGTEGWTKRTIYIVAKELEVTDLNVSNSSVTMTTKETKKVLFHITALSGYDSIKVTNSNNSVLRLTELTNSRIRNTAKQTSYTYKLTPLKAGTSIIKVTSVKDPAYTKTITVTVKKTGSSKPVYYVTCSNGKYTYNAMVNDLVSLTKFHQEDKPVKLTSIGKTLDSRSIYCLRIGNPNAKKRIFLCAGIHGREYMNPYFVMDNIEDMLNHYDTYYKSKGFSYRQLYSSVCLYVVPMINPDGTTIAQMGSSGIRNTSLRANVEKAKKRLRISYSRWKGNARNVNLNRNYSIGWKKLSTYNKEGTSGSKAGSEPETKAIINLVETIKPTAVISYHSMGELFYWGYAIDKSSTCYKQSYAMKKITSKLTGYYAVPCHKSKREAVGCLEDWLAYKKKIPNVCIETGSVSCPLPASQYSKIYSKNKYVVEQICDYFR